MGQALQQAGLLTNAQLGDHPARTAARSRLVVVQPRVWIAATQPVGVVEQALAVMQSVQGPHALLDLSALWRYGLAEPPEVLRLGVRESTRYRVRPPTTVRRVAGHLLEGRRLVAGSWVVALEVALVQAAGVLAHGELRSLVEDVLRRRRTTLPRLRARLRRGLKGSAALRTVLDELVGTSLDGAVRELCAALEARGVTGLRTEVRFVNAAGASAYADVLDEAAATILEVDGFLTHVERQRFRADRRRDRWLHHEHGLLTLRVDVQEVTDALETTADELAAILLARRRQRAA